MLASTDVLEFFESGFYEDCWGWEFQEAEDAAIAEKCATLLEARHGHILDWCGGWGRVSYHLHKRGFKVTILDFVQEYLNRAQTTFGPGAKLTTIQADCRQTPSSIQADYALCLFSSIGFLPDDEQTAAFCSLHDSLAEGAKVVIDCMNQFFIVKHFLPLMESKRPDGTVCRKKNEFDVARSVLISQFEILDGSGAIHSTRHFEQRMYSPRELEGTLKNAGFRAVSMYGDFDQNDMGWDRPQIVTVAQKA